MVGEPSEAVLKYRSASLLTQHLEPVRAEPGDIIFVYNKSDPSWLKRCATWATRFGQSLIRFAFTGEWRSARFSHVALVVAPLIAIHAAPGSVRVEPISRIMPSKRSVQVRVARLAQGLTPDEQQSLVSRAIWFLNQPYAFLFGQSEFPIVRIFRALGFKEHRNTLPFCSHLVADAYAHVGRQIGSLRPDQTLPLDLDEACVGPAWADVTEDYYSSDESVRFAALPPPFTQSADSFAATGSINEELADAAAKLPSFRYDGVASAVGFLTTFRPAVNLHFHLALKIAEAPGRYLHSAPNLFEKDIEALPRLYDGLQSGDLFGGGTITEGLRREFPGYGMDEAPYEGMPTFAEMVRMEFEHDRLVTSAHVVRLHTAIMSCFVATRSVAFDDDRFSGLSGDLVLPILNQLPPLDLARAEILKSAARRLPLESDVPPLGGLLEQMITLHRRLWDERSDFAAKSKFSTTDGPVQ